MDLFSQLKHDTRVPQMLSFMNSLINIARKTLILMSINSKTYELSIKLDFIASLFNKYLKIVNFHPKIDIFMVYKQWSCNWTTMNLSKYELFGLDQLFGCQPRSR